LCGTFIDTIQYSKIQFTGQKKQSVRYFFLRLNPPRSTFSQDMTVEEKNIMQRHVGYWHQLMEQGNVVAFGPVIDPKGEYGVGIIKVENAAMVDELIKNDPAKGLNKYEYYPMMAVVPVSHSESR
jgi:hypothetical protein